MRECMTNLMGLAHGVRYVFSRDLIISEVSLFTARAVSFLYVVCSSQVIPLDYSQLVQTELAFPLPCELPKNDNLYAAA